MHVATSPAFKENAHRALADAGLQKALARSGPSFIARRAAAVAALPEFEQLRDTARDIKNHTLANLDFYLEAYEAKLLAAGGKVHWCATADEARDAVLAICRAANARTVTKGKSMIGEEIAINDHLERNGITPVETDLGEYIIQLRHELPSHIIAPAFHLNLEDWEATFRKSHTDLPPDRIFHERRDILTEARDQAARTLPRRRCRHHRRQLPDRRDRQQRHRHQRRQRRPDADPAARAHRAGQHREDGADDRGLHLAAARAGALGDRAGFFRLHHVLHRRAPAGRSGRAGRIPRRAGGQRPLGDAGHRVPGHAALHPLRRLHEPLPGLRRGRRSRLWLGVSGPDGRGADAVADRRRPGRPSAERLHLLRQVRERLSGAHPAAEPDAPLARARIRTPSHAERNAHGLAFWAWFARRPTLYRLATRAAAVALGHARDASAAGSPGCRLPAAGPPGATCRRRKATRSSPATPRRSGQGGDDEPRRYMPASP